MEPNKLEQLRSNIYTTGFVLEFEVSKILQKHKWIVINNRYYIDDIQRTVREIDIVAYKSSKIEDIRYVTTLIISCKKSNENFWTFLTKDFVKSDPNIDFYPIFNWSNNRILNYIFEEQDWKKKFIKKMKTKNFLKEIYSIPRQVFAAQEMSKTSLKKQNDKNIFNSITSLIKAQSYELASLENRKKEECFYNFNLISIADTELLEAYLENPNCTPQEISGTKYINRYIVNQQDSFYKIDFVKFDAFGDYLRNYDKLHEWNIAFYPKLIDEFYDSIQSTEDIIFFLNLIAYGIQRSFKIKGISYYGNSSEKILNIELNADEPIDDETIIRLNKDDFLKRKISERLDAWRGYKGSFRFVQKPETGR